MHFALLLLLSITAMACRSGEERAPALVLATEMWATTGSDDVAYFGAITGAAATSTGTIWVSDAMAAAIVELSPDGQLLRTISGRGDGPGELQAPSFIASTLAGEMAVLDIARPGIEIFEASGSFVQRVRLGRTPLNPKGFARGPAETFLLSAAFDDASTAIHHLSRTGDLLESWYPIPQPALRPNERQSQANARYVAGGALSLLNDGTILFSQAAPHRIVTFTASAGEERLFASDDSLLAPVVDDFVNDTIIEGRPVTRFRWFFPQSRGVYRLARGYVLNVVTFDEEDQTLFELYGAAGNRIALDIAPRGYWPWDLTPRGDLIASYRDPSTDEHVLTVLRLTLPTS